MFLLTKRYWFVIAYIVLMIIAPVLNTFVEHSTEKQHRLVIFGYFLFMCSFGWLGGANGQFGNGYSPLLFIGLYLLAYYAHFNSKDAPLHIRQLFTFNRNIDLLIYLACMTLNTVLGVTCLYWEKNYYNEIYAYVNPFTVIGALYLLLFFSKLNIKHSKVINTMATGSFAVYLLHTKSELFSYFTYIVRHLYDTYSGVLCITTIFLFLILVYIAAVIVDLPRKWAWEKISKRYQIK